MNRNICNIYNRTEFTGGVTFRFKAIISRAVSLV